jgi:hypothetical protein
MGAVTKTAATTQDKRIEQELGAVIEKSLDTRLLVEFACIKEGRAEEDILLVDIGTLVEQVRDDRGMATLTRNVQRRLMCIQTVRTNHVFLLVHGDLGGLSAAKRSEQTA